MALLRDPGRRVSDVCLDVGFTSLGTFSRTFRAIVGESPSAYRARQHRHLQAVPSCFAMRWERRSSSGEVTAPDPG